MSYKAIVYQVMIAAPSDVEEETKKAKETIYKWNSLHSRTKGKILLPVHWETDTAPGKGKEPQEVVNKQILYNSDLLIGIFWTRIGTPTKEFPSGTIEEIEKHDSLGKPVMIYFSEMKYPTNLETKQLDKVREFRKACTEENGYLYHSYKSLEEFGEKLSDDLTRTVDTNDYFNTTEIDNQPNFSEEEILISKLSDEEKAFLIETSEDKSGYAMKIGDQSNFRISVNDKQLNKDTSPRSIAYWESAIKNLFELDLIDGKDPRGNVFQLTGKGYALADKLKKSKD